MMNIGILGGTFDPPHIGHLILASEALDQLNLEKVLWVLTPSPPHKMGNYISPLNQRKELLLNAIRGETRFEYSDVDIDRPAPHYAVDTVKILKGLYKGYNLIYIMGGDSLRDLPTWHDPSGFVNACDKISVMHRPDGDFDLNILEGKLPGIGDKVEIIDFPLIFISSSEIRKRIKTGRMFKWLVPESVYQTIKKNNYYQQL